MAEHSTHYSSCKLILHIMAHVAFVAGFFYFFLSMASRDLLLYLHYTKDDGLLESIQFFLLLMSAACCCTMSMEFHRQKDRWNSKLFALGMIVFMFVAMEEISWGQRILSVETPSWLAKINKQSETNLHNLKGLSNRTMHVIAGTYGVFSGLVYYLFMRSTKIWYSNFSPPLRIDLCVIPVQYIAYFVPLFLYGFKFFWRFLEWLTKLKSHTYQEVAELLLYLGCYLTLISHVPKVSLKNKKTETNHT